MPQSEIYHTNMHQLNSDHEDFLTAAKHETSVLFNLPLSSLALVEEYKLGLDDLDIKLNDIKIVGDDKTTARFVVRKRREIMDLDRLAGGCQEKVSVALKQIEHRVNENDHRFAIISRYKNTSAVEVSFLVKNVKEFADQTKALTDEFKHESKELKTEVQSLLDKRQRIATELKLKTGNEISAVSSSMFRRVI